MPTRPCKLGPRADQHQHADRATPDLDWRDHLTEHFRNIFHKQSRETVDKRIGEILRRLEYACKIHAWRPFTEDELRALRKRWKNGKSCGTDQISHEALKALEFKMGPKLLALFNDLLYTCRIPEAIERGITVFWQKQRS